MNSESGIYKQINGAYALNRDRVYEELDARGLHRVRSLATLHREGVLERGNSSHYTKRCRVFKTRVVRAVFVRLDKEVDQEVKDRVLN